MSELQSEPGSERIIRQEPRTETHIRNAVRRKPRQRPWPRSVRLTEAIDNEITRYLEQNAVNFNQLCTFALERFIRQPQRIDLLPVGSSGAESASAPPG
jgi:hypothetical protein